MRFVREKQQSVKSYLTQRKLHHQTFDISWHLCLESKIKPININPIRYKLMIHKIDSLQFLWSSLWIFIHYTLRYRPTYSRIECIHRIDWNRLHLNTSGPFYSKLNVTMLLRICANSAIYMYTGWPIYCICSLYL